MNKTQEEHLCRDIHKIALALEKIAKALPSAEQEAPDINVGNMDTTTHDSIPAETGKNDGDKTSGDCISRQQAIDALCSVCNALGGGHNCDKTKFVYNAPFDEQVILCPEHYALTMLPSAQPDIIRCKDCKHLRFFDPCFYCYEMGGEIIVPENGFCFKAERREDG